jgi:hypothetical protein
LERTSASRVSSTERALIYGKIDIAVGRDKPRPTEKTAISYGIFILGFFGASLAFSRTLNIIAGEIRQPHVKMTRLIAVSRTADFAHTFEIPALYVSFSSL